MGPDAAHVREALRNLPEYLGQHVLITAVALGLGIAISLPVAVAVVHRVRLRWSVLAVASVIQTVPSLALLAIFYLVLLGVAWVTGRLFGFEISALGFLPTVIGLTLYSMLPILRNTVTGILGVDPAVREAAVAAGMRPRQVLMRVELPLAMPVIVAGIRTATVWVVGIATLSTPIGQTSLGNYIFTGLQTQNWISVLFGVVLAAVLAIVLDQLIGLAESGAAQRSRRRVLAAGVGLVAVLAGGILPWRLTVPDASAQRQAYRVGAKNFTEQFILASLLRDTIRTAGMDATKMEGLGSMVAFEALANGDIDVYVDYSGTVWANYMKRTSVADAETVLREMTDWLAREKGIRCLGPLGFENAYALAMRRDRAEQLSVRTIADLAPHAPRMTIGGDYEFFGRPEWKHMREAYGLRFAERKQYQSTFMYEAVTTGEVDVISAFSSDGRIAAYDLVVLDDPKHVIPPYDAVVLVSPKAAKDRRLVESLRPLIGTVPVRWMREANLMVDRDENKRTVDQAAAWLRERLAGPPSAK